MHTKTDFNNEQKFHCFLFSNFILSFFVRNFVKNRFFPLKLERHFLLQYNPNEFSKYCSMPQISIVRFQVVVKSEKQSLQNLTEMLNTLQPWMKTGAQPGILLYSQEYFEFVTETYKWPKKDVKLKFHREFGTAHIYVHLILASVGLWDITVASFIRCVPI